MGRLDNDRDVGGMIDATSYFELEAEEYQRRGVVLTPELWMVKLMVGAIDPTYDEQVSDPTHSLLAQQRIVGTAEFLVCLMADSSDCLFAGSISQCVCLATLESACLLHWAGKGASLVADENLGYQAWQWVPPCGIRCGLAGNLLHMYQLWVTSEQYYD